MPVIQAGELKSFTTRLLQAGGFAEDDASQTADLLVWANLRGTDSHGVLRVPRYIEMIDQGIMVSGGSLVAVKEHGAIAIIDGGECPGAVGMNAAVARAEDIARRLGVGWCAVRAISHAGAIGYFASKLASRGMIGIVLSASKPLMAYIGAKGEAVSTNPLAIAVPVENADPILLDMSTAAVTLGKIMAAKDTGKPIPMGWAIDESGAETTDPHKVDALLPMAGAKGSGLSLMIELLTSVLAGNAVIGPILLGQKSSGFNGLVIAVDPAAFGALDDFNSAVNDLVAGIHGLEPAPGVIDVLLPGERSAGIGRKREVDGIPVAAGTVKRLVELAQRLEVAIPPAFTST